MEQKNDPNTPVERQLHTADARLLVRQAPEGGEPSRTITGYALLFSTPSAPLYEDDDEECREVIAPEAVSRALLDGCDIKMTLFHDRQLILARSRQGQGTLSYSVDEKGVAFSFEAPRTADGDKALELVRRGDISGCSFAFRTHYFDPGFVSRTVERRDGKARVTYTVRRILDIRDFTLTPDPAYPDTSCQAAARSLFLSMRSAEEARGRALREQVLQMRRAAGEHII